MNSEFDLARIVRSKAGRDKGKYFIILESDGSYSFIANGNLRKSDAPKKKKNRHLQGGFGFSELILDKIKNGGKVTDAELRKELESFEI